MPCVTKETRHGLSRMRVLIQKKKKKKRFFQREGIVLDEGEDASDNGLEEEVEEETEKEKDD